MGDEEAQRGLRDVGGAAATLRVPTAGPVGPE